MKEVYRDCRICEDDNYGNGCFLVCEDCYSCEEDCDEVCSDCWSCEEQSEELSCIEKCEDNDCAAACMEKSDCPDGFRDCDGDGICETEGLCGQIDICDDGIDNNDNGFIDCEESKCEGLVCGGNMYCIAGICATNTSVEIAVTVSEETLANESVEMVRAECVVVGNCDDDEVCSNGVCKVLEVEEVEEVPLELEPIEESSETGFSVFRLITGRTVEGCDCGANMECDNGQCYCAPGYRDCNEEDGCESTDLTCGGTTEICPAGCHDNQLCREEYGWCECVQGYYDCDGDWLNGCESTTVCASCQEDSDCAAPRCAEYGNVVEVFGCIEGEPWMEQRGQLQICRGCINHPTGRVDSYVQFDAWGDSFTEFNELREGIDYGKNWCQFELESLLRERREIEKSLTPDTLTWFYDEYVQAEPEEWEQHSDGIWEIFWVLQNVNSRIAERAHCLNVELPEMNPLHITYSGEFGAVEFWERFETVNLENLHGESRGIVAILSPYMKLSLFPPKAFVKQEIQEQVRKGYFPGPGGGNKPGLSRSRIESIRHDEFVMEQLRKVLDDYGGELRLKGVLRERDVVGEILIIINEQDILVVTPGLDLPEDDIDYKIQVDFNFLYDFIKFQELDRDYIEVPYWKERDRNVIQYVRERKDDMIMFSKLLNAYRQGHIKITPAIGVFDIYRLMQDLDDIFGGHE